ncbi:MAG: hypothetical protein K8963_05820 [Proteobacteria bacterium]|nr:hypothetical protein [Pseudomonadota bacterium]
MKIDRRTLLQNCGSAFAGWVSLGAASTESRPIYNRNIRLFYRPEMALKKDRAANYSKSPRKPRLFLQFLRRKKLLSYFDQSPDWKPFERPDFLIAHTRKYVDAFFAGAEPLASSNGLAWSAQFADSVRYTNASLYYALAAAVTDPATVTLSPSSGFHHAMPARGLGFCTFSGQVIASTKIYRQYKVSGAYIDLDGHYGNSIEDSRRFVGDLNLSVPPGCNVNPQGAHGAYLKDLRYQLLRVRDLLLEEKIHYVVCAHGADSHEWDNLGGQCTTEEWMEASRLVYTWVKAISRQLGRPVPLVLTLFGGYRADDYDAVLSLHAADAALCQSILCGQPLYYRPEVSAPVRKTQ